MHYRGLLRVVRPRARHPDLRRRTNTSPAPATPTHGARASTRSSISSCASTRRCPRASLAGLVSRLRYAVPQWRGELKAAFERARSGWHTHASTASTGTGRRRSAPGARRAAGRRAPPDAVRSRGLGSPALRAVLGLGLPFRGLHSGAEAQARLLRAAAPLARPVIGWGNVSVVKGRVAMGRRATRRRSRLPIAPSRASSRPSWIACGGFSGCRIRNVELRHSRQPLRLRPMPSNLARASPSLPMSSSVPAASTKPCSAVASSHGRDRISSWSTPAAMPVPESRA